MSIAIRIFHPEDVGQLAHVFHLSVNLAAIGRYSLPERQAWSPEVRSDEYWLARLAQTTTWVAAEQGVIAGFINLKSPRLEDDALEAEIDCLFTHPEYLGRGVASELYQALQLQAGKLGIDRLTVEASYLAKPFFEKQGFTRHSRNEHARGEQILVNFSMSKIL